MVAALFVFSACSGCGGGGSQAEPAPSPPSYFDASATLPAVAANLAAAGDFDGDGLSDIVLAGDGAPQILQSQAGTLVTISGAVPPIDVSTFGVAVADLDGDGDLDIVLANGTSSRSATLTASASGGGQDIEIASNMATTAQTAGRSIMQKRTSARSEGLLAFPTSRYPGWTGVHSYAQVTSARLDLFQRNFATATAVPAVTVDIHQNLRTFVASGTGATTWNDWHGATGQLQPTEVTASASAAFPGGTLVPPGAYRSVTVTALAQTWVRDRVARDRGCTISGTASTLGIFLASDDVATGVTAVVQAHPWNPPRLAIDYVDSANTILINRGNMSFADESAARLPERTALISSRAVAVADVNQDGWPDLVFANDGAPPELLLNRGPANPGVFEDASSALPARSARDRGVAVADVTGDGIPDLVFVARQEPAALFVGRGALFNIPAFADETAARIGAQDPDADDIAAGDVTGSGAPDLLVGTSSPTFAQLWLNDGAGGFSDGSTALAAAGATASCDVFFADLNGDGRDDIVAPDTGGQPVVLMCVGRASFVDISTVVPSGAAGATAVAAGDFDGDGRQDLFLVGPSGPATLLLQREAQP